MVRRIFNKKRILITVVLVVMLTAAVSVAKSGKNITIEGTGNIRPVASSTSLKKGELSGLPCEKAGQRPLAVMYSSDKEARPLSGIDSVDMVIEMPVTESGVTRMMALFQCQTPSEFGSIRSARLDFIPFVSGFDAIYLHWGGEHEALARLDSGATDNIDCLKLDGTICRRKSNIVMPHNGFSLPSLISGQIKNYGYRTSLNGTWYQFEKDKSSDQIIAPPVLYSGTFAVRWVYDRSSNRYGRYRGGTMELDKLSNLQVQADNVIVMNTTSEYINVLYNRVRTIGSGAMTLYKNGTAVSGTWQKPSEVSRLIFKDARGEEIKLNEGTTWIEIVTN